MASNLLSAGFRLVVYDRNVAAVDEMKAKGALEARDPEEVASQSDVVITMLPSSPNVSSVKTHFHLFLHSGSGFRLLLVVMTGTWQPWTR